MNEALAQREKTRRRIQLDKDLENLVFNKKPFDRVKNGHSAPFAVISYPLLDQDRILNPRAWQGLIKQITELKKMNPEHFAMNQFQLFMLGGVIGDWRFLFSKNEGSRLMQQDFNEDPFNQENLSLLENKFRKAREKIAELPDDVTIVYAYGEKDDKNITELFSYAIDRYATKVNDIYKRIKSDRPAFKKVTKETLSEIKALNKDLESQEDKYRLTLEKIESETSIKIGELEKKIDLTSKELKGVQKTHKETKKDKIPEIEAKYNTIQESLKEVETNINIAEGRLKRSSKRNTKEKIEEEISKLKETKIQLENDSAVEIKKKAKVEKVRNRLNETMSRLEARLEIYENEIEKAKNKSIYRVENANETQEEAIENIRDRYLTKMTSYLNEIVSKTESGAMLVLDTSNTLMDEFNVPTMAHFKDRFSKVVNVYQELGKSTRNLISLINEDFNSKKVTEELREFSKLEQKLATHYEEIVRDFSISEMFSRVTKRKIPVQLRAEIIELIHKKYADMLETAISDDGERNVVIRDNFNNEYSFLGVNSETIKVRFGGYGAKRRFDLIKGARSSLRNRLNGSAEGLYNIVDRDFIDNPFGLNISDLDNPEVISERALANEKIDFVLTGPSSISAAAPMGLPKSPHNTTIVSVAPFYDTKAAIHRSSKGTKTQETMQGIRGYQSGSVLIDTGRDIPQVTITSTKNLEDFKGFDVPGIWMTSLGDEHVGAGNCNLKALNGVYHIVEHDSHLELKVQTGDPIEGEYRKPTANKKHESGLKSMANQGTHYFAIEQDSRKAVLDRSTLLSPLVYSLGQHDISPDGTYIMGHTYMNMILPYLTKGERLLFPTYLKLREQGEPTPLDNKPIHLAFQSGTGFSYVPLSFAENPNDCFGALLIDHGKSFSTWKSSKYDPTSGIGQFIDRRGITNQDIALTLTGDRHAMVFGQGANGNFFRCGSFKGNESTATKPLMLADDFELNFSYHNSPAYARMFLPRRYKDNPMSVTIVPEAVLNKVYEVHIAPKVRTEIDKIGQDYFETLMMK